MLIDKELPLSLFNHRLDKFQEFMQEEIEIKNKSKSELAMNIDEYAIIKKQTVVSNDLTFNEFTSKVCQFYNVAEEG